MIGRLTTEPKRPEHRSGDLNLKIPVSRPFKTSFGHHSLALVWALLRQ